MICEMPLGDDSRRERPERPSSLDVLWRVWTAKAPGILHLRVRDRWSR
jgi:hypothetical protein